MKITKVGITDIPRRGRNKIVTIVEDFIDSDARAIKIEDDKNEYKNASGLSGVFRNAVKRLGLTATIEIVQNDRVVYLVKKAALPNDDKMLDM